METIDIINLILDGKNSQAQETVNDLLYAKAGEILSQRKQELGNQIFNQEEE